MLKNKKICFVLSFVIVLLLIATISPQAAWQDPTLAPPDGNIDAPINVGLTDQFKTGRLRIGDNGPLTFGILEAINRGGRAAENLAAVYGQSTNNDGVGVAGQAAGSYGVAGISNFSSGIYGISNYGQDETQSATSLVGGVYGTDANRQAIGILGRKKVLVVRLNGIPTTFVNRYGVYGEANNLTDYGVNGQSNNGTGVRGFAGQVNAAGQGVGGKEGVYGGSYDGYGIHGMSSNNVGVRGYSTNNYGVSGETRSVAPGAAGVYGNSDNGTGVFGQATVGTGVNGSSVDGVGIEGSSTNGTGIHGDGNVYGVKGDNSQVGVYGQGTRYGVEGESANKGVYGHSASVTGDGVYGENTSTGQGVHGKNSSSGQGIYGENTSTGQGVSGYNTSTGYGMTAYGLNNAFLAYNADGATGVYLAVNQNGTSYAISSQGDVQFDAGTVKIGSGITMESSSGIQLTQGPLQVGNNIVLRQDGTAQFGATQFNGTVTVGNNAINMQTNGSVSMTGSMNIGNNISLGSGVIKSLSLKSTNTRFNNTMIGTRGSLDGEIIMAKGRRLCTVQVNDQNNGLTVTCDESCTGSAGNECACQRDWDCPTGYPKCGGGICKR